MWRYLNRAIRNIDSDMEALISGERKSELAKVQEHPKDEIKEDVYHQIEDISQVTIDQGNAAATPDNKSNPS